jgi:hypothetical protein
MPHQNDLGIQQDTEFQSGNDFLTPEQRSAMVVEILARAALRLKNKQQEPAQTLLS